MEKLYATARLFGLFCASNYCLHESTDTGHIVLTSYATKMSSIMCSTLYAGALCIPLCIPL